MPVHDHVAVFESAHDSLRRALDQAAGDGEPRAKLRPASRARADPCRHGGYGSTPSWCGAAPRVPASTPPS